MALKEKTISTVIFEKMTEKTKKMAEKFENDRKELFDEINRLKSSSIKEKA